MYIHNIESINITTHCTGTHQYNRVNRTLILSVLHQLQSQGCVLL